mmetsp:Transcript_53292/g.87096  ORF Transcript_53292/g.87096 Transcript_53292/m.87096 type:complete len:99 (+) Transcript_53292:657-953(+)
MNINKESRAVAKRAQPTALPSLQAFREEGVNGNILKHERQVVAVAGSSSVFGNKEYVVRVGESGSAPSPNSAEHRCFATPSPTSDDALAAVWRFLWAE